MALTLTGKQYICENFGNGSFCCVNTGLSWYYTVGGTNYNETGGTAQIVSRFASGLIDSLTMTSPARGTFTQTQLNTANGSSVTLQDALEITYHDESTEDQWCFIPCESHADDNTCVNVYGCFWYNGSCHTTSPSCEQLNNATDCSIYGCHWYNGSCHSSWTCNVITNATDCSAYGCFWYNGVCNSTMSCEAINNSTECLAYNCYWYNNSCHGTVSCEAISTEVECENHGCYWWNGACHSTAPSCPALNNQSDCLGYGCYWYHNVCHSIDQSNLCYYLDAHWPLVIANVFEIVDAFLFSTPPSGYTFVPTIQNVFGVIDYYLGFDGDVATGCSIIGG